MSFMLDEMPAELAETPHVSMNDVSITYPWNK